VNDMGNCLGVGR